MTSEEKSFKDAISRFVKSSPEHRKLLARELGVSFSSVDRWTIGANAPHPAMRPVVIKFVSDHKCEC